MINIKTIKDLRTLTGLSQSQFSQKYNIPIKTLQHWEGGYSDPAPYLLNLLEKDINLNTDIVTIEGCNKKERTMYYYNPVEKFVSDQDGNFISVEIDFSSTSKHNLGIFLDMLFEQYAKAKNNFLDNLQSSQKEQIEWERLD